MTIRPRSTAPLKYKPATTAAQCWGTGQDGYFAVLSADAFALHGIKDGAVVRDLARAKPVMQQGVWHLLEIATVAGRIEVRADGAEGLVYEGPAQEAGDLLGIGSAFLPADSVVLVDDLSVCSMRVVHVDRPGALTRRGQVVKEPGDHRPLC
jgi:hypothetical protein